MTIVTGASSMGMMKGIWKGRETPAAGKEYHIELSIDNPEEADIPRKGKQSPFVCLHNDIVTFQGICEGMDDEVYYLRFDIDWMEMLDIHVTAFKKKKGEYISFSAGVYGIGIYPYTI